jgi:hypothetical protein
MRGTAVAAAVPDRARTPQTFAPIVAVFSVVLVGANFSVKYGITVAAVPVILLAPVWIAALGRHAGARLVIATAGAAVIAGMILSRISSADHATGHSQTISSAMLVVSGFGAVGVLLWCGEVLGRRPTIVLYGLAFALAQVMDHASWADNPWKHGFAFPATVVALALASKARTVGPTLVTLAVAGLLSIANDYRSFFAFCVIVALLVVWQEFSRSTSRTRHRFAPLLLLGALGIAAYYAVTTLLVEGYLGPEVQERSIEQIDASGSLLVGGRPEWAATIRLMSEHPWGYGFGVAPNAADVSVGDAGLLSVNINPDYGYNVYMFAGQFRLHSIAADLWASTGVIGIVLGLVVFGTLAHWLAVGLESRRLDALTIILVVIASWDLVFSPIFTSLKDVTVALFLVLSLAPPVLRRTDRRARRRPPHGSRPRSPVQSSASNQESAATR